MRKTCYLCKKGEFENQRGSLFSNLPHITVRGLYCCCIFVLIYPKGCQAISQGNSALEFSNPNNQIETCPSFRRHRSQFDYWDYRIPLGIGMQIGLLYGR